MTEPIRVLGVSGSLRKASYNTAVLRAAQELAPEGMTITIADISEIPPYDEDVRAKGLPESVQRFRDAIAGADAILFATPEYNFSMSGVLKNAIDWASRPPSQPFADKPISIIGASGGMGGTMRAQYDLRRSAVFLDMHVLNKPEVFVRSAGEKIDASGKLTDEPTRKILGEHLAALAKWTHRIRSTR